MIRFPSQQQSTEKSFPDLTSMIDVLFILLIFLLVLALYASPAIRVSLPGAATAETEALSLVVTLDADGALSLDGEDLSWDDLPGALTAALAETDQQTVYLAADENALHGDVLRLMDICRAAGAGEVGFLTEE